MLKYSEAHERTMRPPAAAQANREPVATHQGDCADQERWARVRKQLRTIVGDDIFSSWFASMDLMGVDGDTVRFSVPTRFLKSWIQAHYVDRILACWQTEQCSTRRVELVVRSPVRASAAKGKPEQPVEVMPELRKEPVARIVATPVASAHEALGGSPLDPRLTFDTFAVGRSNTLAHAAAKQVAQ